MMNAAGNATPTWVAAVENAVATQLHQIPYGNLRISYSEWDDAEGRMANLALVYEVPGGSTNQINITWFEATEMFNYLSLNAQEEECTASLDDVLAMVKVAVERIPDIRSSRLCEDIDRWAAQGLRHTELFQKMTKLLQFEDLRGGTITMQEMKSGVNYILAHYRAPAGEAG